MEVREKPSVEGQARGAKYKRVTSSTQSENPFASLIPDQAIAIIPSITLESGDQLINAPIAYSTRGKLSESGDNAMIICHALTGSADVSDWWGPLLGGPGRSFDITRFYIVCMNSLGSPYGSASPVTNKDGDSTQGLYGPDFPLTTIRDDVRAHKMLLDDLGVKQVAAVIGGSMGGMLVLEWAYFGKDYIRSIIPIATSSRHSAWGISWGEAQRQSIYSDPKYNDGYYSFYDPPSSGLGAARMSALLTYRSRNSFEARFGRNAPDSSRRQSINGNGLKNSDKHWAVHNEGHKSTGGSRSSSSVSISSNAATSNGVNTPNPKTLTNGTSATQFSDPQFSGARLTNVDSTISIPIEQNKAPTYFSAQSYLRYQGDKFVKRFDSNCYIAITRKMDTHDVSRNRVSEDSSTPVADALSQIQQPTLVLGIESDGLFNFAEQQELAACILKARLRTIISPEGHDAFLLQFEQVNNHIIEFLEVVLPDIMGKPGIEIEGVEEEGVGKVTKNSTFGEAEVEDITAW